MVRRLCILLVIAIGVTYSLLVGEQKPTAQVKESLYQGNNCVSCHSALNEPLRVSMRYYEWRMTPHQEKGVGCEKCHGGDATTADIKKAHAGVLRSSDSQSRLHHKNQPETCGSCHQSVVNAFVRSNHYQKLKGVGMGPSCNTCHAHMATQVIYSAKETANLCAYCHNADNFIIPRPDIPRRANDTILAIQRARSVINWANLLLTHGQRSGLSVDAERGDLKHAQETLRDAQVNWHTFNLEAVQKQADDSFHAATKVRDDLRKRLSIR
ncbi:MAG: cytochrome c3 family protein [Acidobacteria bacterium]|nr:cytochrome c3 family protein [Acidobacteriota bacterium]